jgi:hypothetical protein
MQQRKGVILAIVLAAGGLLAASLTLLAIHWRPRLIMIQGAVIRANADPRKQIAIGNATVTVSDGDTIASGQSQKSGYFKLTFREGIRLPKNAALIVRHNGYAPFVTNLPLTPRSSLRKIYVVKLRESDAHTTDLEKRSQTRVSNVIIRYTVNAPSTTNIGTAVKTFEVINHSNVPCRHQAPCSPNGFWKAARASVTLKAGSNNKFRNVRVLCIAGPCAFTRVHLHKPGKQTQTIAVSAVDWSDTTTFLVEAEVYHNAISSQLRESYPVIFGRDMHFTLPPTAEGPSIVAEIGNQSIVFPLASGLYMSWATCNSEQSRQTDNSTIFQCELKPGYRF